MPTGGGGGRDEAGRLFRREGENVDTYVRKTEGDERGGLKAITQRGYHKRGRTIEHPPSFLK